jgi:hypothetical protein
MKADDERLRELVSGHGEVWSAKMITALFNSRGHNFHCIDARKVLVVKHTDVGDGREVQWVTSHDLLAAELARAPVGCHLVITGFIASTTDGVMTTLRRDGRCVCVCESAVTLGYFYAFRSCSLLEWLAVTTRRQSSQDCSLQRTVRYGRTYRACTLLILALSRMRLWFPSCRTTRHVSWRTLGQRYEQPSQACIASHVGDCMRVFG